MEGSSAEGGESAKRREALGPVPGSGNHDNSSGRPVGKFEDSDFKEGQVGMILFGEGRAVFRDLIAEEVSTTNLAPPLTPEPGVESRTPPQMH